MILEEDENGTGEEEERMEERRKEGLRRHEESYGTHAHALALATGRRSEVAGEGGKRLLNGKRRKSVTSLHFSSSPTSLLFLPTRYTTSPPNSCCGNSGEKIARLYA